MRIVSSLLLLLLLTLTSTSNAQVPNLVNGAATDSFPGEQFCFDADLTNSGGPGFGPYLRLSLAPEISFDSATFLGTAMTTTAVGVYPASPGNMLTDPVSGDLVTGLQGGSLTLIRYPIGSVVTGGPILTATICATIASSTAVDVDLDVTLQAVYEFGDTATGNNGRIEGAIQSALVHTILIIVTKENNAPESENPPSDGTPYINTYTINTDVATSKTVFDPLYTDIIPAGVQYDGNLMIIGGTNCAANAEPSLIVPGGTLSISCDSITGTIASNDMVFSYDSHIVDILDETNCTNIIVTNNLSLDYEFPDNTPQTSINNTSDISAEHLVIRKAANPGLASPGDIITFTLNFAVTSFNDATALDIVDILPDGYTFVSHTGMTVNGSAVAIVPGVSVDAAGVTTIVYNVDAVTALPFNTTGIISYTASIDQVYTATSNPILAADSLTNSVIATWSLADGATDCSDNSAATVDIIPIAIDKIIVNPLAEYVPGDIVTFRLSMTIPSGDSSAIIFEDFFPLPVFDVTNVNLSYGADIRRDLINDTLNLIPTSITSNAATNSIRIAWPNVSSMITETISIDIDITIVDDPFADQLFLTNLFQAETENTPGTQAIGVNPVMLNVRAPELVITKGIFASSNPLADASISPSPAVLPVDGDISLSDAGDMITYVITVENQGGAIAFDVLISDPGIAGLTASNIVSVVDGNGFSIGYRDPLDPATAPAPPTLPIPSDLSAGIVLDFALSNNDGNLGAPFSNDTAIITIISTVESNVTPRTQITNTASATWGSLSGAVSFPIVSDTATTTIAGATISKAITNVFPEAAGPGRVTSGDTISYRLTVNLPEGIVTDLNLSDALPAGFEFIAGSVVIDDSAFAGTIDTAPTASTAGAIASGLTLNIAFDSPTSTTVNADNNAGNNSFTVSYMVRVNDDVANDGLPTIQAKTNTVTLTYTGISGAAIQASASTNYAEPDLSISKSMSPNTNVDANDNLTITLTVTNNGTSPAYDLLISDTLNDAGTLFDLSSVAALITPPNFNFSYANPTVTYTMTSGSLAPTASVIFTFSADVNDAVFPQQTLTNLASVSGDSQLGLVSQQRTSSDTSTASSVTVDSAVIVKSIASISPNAAPGFVTSGDAVTYQFLVTLPEGTTANLILNDTLPPGFVYQAASVLVDTTGFAGVVDTVPVVSTAGNIDAGGQTIQLQFAGNTSVTSDNNAGNNSFTVSLIALVENRVINDGLPASQVKTNRISLSYTGIPGTVEDTVSINFAEPNLIVVKTMTPDTGLSAGDTVTIGLQVNNTGTAPAYDINVTDILNDGGAELLFDTASAIATTTPAGFSSSFADPTISWDANPNISLAAGATLLFQFTATVRSDVVTGSSFDNLAAVNGDNQESVVAEERTSTDTDTDTANTELASNGKTLIASSESDTSDPEVSIGELLTYRYQVTLPEGVTRQDASTTAIITDTLPAGFAYQLGTATLSASFDTGINGSTLGAIGAGPAPIVPTVNGQVLEFDLGDLTNSDDDGNAESITLEYQVLALNTSDNNRSNSKTNTASLHYENADGNGQTINDTVTLTIAEPSLAIVKSALPATIEGGNTVTFTVVVSNPVNTNVSRAWEPIITDTLPARYQAPFSVVSVTHSIFGLLPTAGSFTGNALSVDLSSDLIAANNHLDPGATITLIYTAVIDPAINFEEMVTNTALVVATSLPGSNGTGASAPGVPGDSDGERTGSGMGENDLQASDSATVVAGRPTITKIAADDTLQILETTLVTLTVDVPVGTTNAFVLTDDLPSGLSYTGTAITLTPPVANFSSTLSPSTTPGAGTDPLIFNFGDITNSAMTAQQIVIAYEVSIDNSLANQNNTLLTNTASLNYVGVSMPLPTVSETITVIEANLEIAKTITSGAAGSDAGDAISYQIVVTNTDAVATAYRVNLQDTLPEHLLGGTPTFSAITLDNDGGAVTENGGASLTAGDAILSSNAFIDDTLSLPLFDIPPLASLTITYTAILSDDSIAGEILTNLVTANYNSLTVGGGRDNTDSNNDDDGLLNNYGETDSANLTVDSSIAIQKSLNIIHPNNDFTIGDLITFDIRVDVIEGIKGNVTITDTLPSGLSFEGPISIVAGATMSYSGAGTAVELPVGTLTIDMGNVTNTSDMDINNDFFIIEINARVDDIPVNIAGLSLTNTASLTSDVGPAGPATQVIDITEPNLVITKTPDDSTPPLDGIVNWTINVAHSASTADAFDVNLSDLIPAGLSYITGSHSGDGSVDETDLANPLFDLAGITLLEMSKSFGFQTRVDAGATVNQAIVNTINLSYDGQSAAPSVERGYIANAMGIVTPDVAAFIEALKTVTIAVDGGTAGVVDPGDTLEYTIVLSNTATPVTNSVFTDTVPSNSTYVAATLSSSKGIIDDSSAPNLIVTVGSLASLEIVTITFQVTVDAGTPAGTIISNQGSIDSDQTVPEPTDVDGVDENGDQPTDIPVAGPPSITNALYVEKRVDWLIDADASIDITAGDTMRYTLIISNLGNAALDNVLVNDTLASGLTYVAASAGISGGNSISVVGSNLTINIPSLAIGTNEVASFDVTIDVFAPASMTFINQAAIDSDQTSNSLSDGNGDPSDGLQDTRFTAVNGISGAPILDVEKRWSLAVDNDGDGLVDPGDTLEYELTLINTGSAAATNVRLNDSIPADTTLVIGSASLSQGAIVSEDPINFNIGTINPGGLISARFRVTVDAGTPDGTIIPNQAFVTADTGINEPSDDNGDDSDGKNPTLTPVDTGGGAGTSSLAKILQTTSETSSSTNNLLIGEVATFRVSLDVPAGLTREVSLIDTLPVGLSYIASTASLARSFDTGLASSQNPASINSVASGTFVGLADGTEILIAGSTLSVFLGDLINSDSDLNAETYTLEIQVVAENSIANQAGVSLSNQASLSFLNGLGQAQSLTPVISSVLLIEPAIQVAKTALPSAILSQGGDVQFTVVISNPNGAFLAPAYDLNLIDSLSAEWTSLTVDSITPAGGVSGVTDNSSGTTLDIDVSIFPISGSLTIVYTASAAGILPLANLVNTVNVTWTSLPGVQGTANATPGNPGDIDGERTGSGIGNNDYLTSDTASISVGSINLSKSILNPQTRYAIGDVINYQVVLSIPDGVSIDSNQVTDVLDEGLTYINGSYSASLDAGLNAGSNPADFTRTDNSPNPGEESLAANFATIINSAGSSANLTITYDVLVDNILPNQNNQSLNNSVRLDFDNPAGGAMLQLTDTATITVGEPVVTLLKTILPPTTNLDAGDSVNFRIDISNSGTTSAFETLVSDALPSGLINVSALSVISTSGGAQTPTLTNNGNDWFTSGFDLPVGSSVRIEFNALIDNIVIPGQAIQNTASALFSSRDGSDSNERDGSGGINDYTVSDSSSAFTIADPVQIDKRFFPDAGITTYTIGESFQYRLSVNVIEGVTDEILVSDTLPDNIRFVSAIIGLGNMGMTSEFAGTPSQLGQTLSFNFGDINNPANASMADDVITMDITVIVENVPINVDGLVLGNNANVSYMSAMGPQIRDFDADTVAAGIQALDLVLIEPNLQLIKSVSSPQAPPGGAVNFNLLLDHTALSTADAFDLIVMDTLDIGLSYVPGSSSIPVTVMGQDLMFSIAALTLIDDQTTISYTASVDNNVALNTVLANFAILDYTSQPGINPDERSYQDTDTISITVATTSFIEAVKTVILVVDGSIPGQVDPGDTLEYTIILDNNGSAVTNAVFSDPLPAFTSYVAASLTSSVGVIDDSGDPLLVLIGNMADGETVSLSFQVTVDAGTPAGTIISNQGSIDSDQTVPEPSDQDGIDANGDQPTDIPVGPAAPLNDALYVQKVVEWLVDVDISGTISPGDLLRYVFIIQNVGDSALSNVNLTDTVPTGLTAIPASASVTGIGSSIGLIGANLTVDILSLAIGESQTASFEFNVDGPLFNSDADPLSETFINQAIAMSDKTAPILSDNDGNPANGDQVTVFTAVDGIAGTPLLDVEKRVSLVIDLDGDGLVDPNDTLEYVITVNNFGSATANNVFLDDAIPNDTTIVIGSAGTSQGILVSESPLSVNLFNIDPAQIVTISFRVNVDPGTLDGTIIVNQASVSGDNFPDEPSDDNGNDADGLNPNLTPVDTGSGSGMPSGLDKVRVTTSEVGSANEQVLIGESVTYQVTITLPLGQTNEVTLIDNLPVGLQYLAGSASLARVFDLGINSSVNPGNVNTTATTLFTGLIDGSELIVSGQQLSVFLGDVINSDNDANSASFILRFDALVENIASNQASVSLNNQATISYLDSLSQLIMLTPVTEAVTIIEPQLQITKTSNTPLLLLGGGDVIYTLVITNPSSATAANAYDVSLIDNLPAQFSTMNIDSITPLGGTSGIVDSSAGTNLAIQIDLLPPGGSLTVIVTANAVGPLLATTMTNNVSSTWTSLPGANGTAAPGIPGDVDGERIGTGGINDYANNDQTDVTLGDLGFSKLIVNPQSVYAIGSDLVYQLQLGIPANGRVDTVSIEDILDSGLSYLPGSLTITYPAGTSSSTDPLEFTLLNDTPLVGQTSLGLDLGTLSEIVGALAVIEFNYSVRVDNNLLNQDAFVLNNNVTLEYVDPGTGTTRNLNDNQQLTLGEPHLLLDKTITSPIVGLDAGDSIDFNVTVTNDGNLTAFETQLNDILPLGLDSISNLTVSASSGGAEIPVLTNNVSNWSTTGFDLPPAASVSIDFTAQISVDVLPGSSLVNDVSASYASLDTNPSQARDGSSAGSEQDNDSQLDNYRTSDPAPAVIVADPVAIDKRFFPDPNNTQYTIGEIVTYRLTVALIEGTLNELVVTDVLPNNLLFISAQVGLGNMGMTSNYSSPPSQSGQSIGFDFGQVINPANGNTADDLITIDIQTQVANVTANQNGDILGNNASLTFLSATGMQTREFDADPMTAGIQALDLVIIEPELDISKTVDRSIAQPGEEVTFSLTLAHLPSSTQDAFDLEVIDTLPIGLSYVMGSSTAPVNVNGQELRFDGGDLLQAGILVISYRARIDFDVVLGVPLENLAQAFWSTLDGDVGGERTGSGGVNDLISITVIEIIIPTAPALTLTKTDFPIQNPLMPGQSVTYELVLENLGNSSANNVIINDTPDPKSRLVVGSVSTTQGTVIIGNNAGDTSIRIDVGSLAPSETVTIAFEALLVAVGSNTLANQATALSDELPPIVSDDPETGDPDDPTLTPIVAPLAIPSLSIEGLGLLILLMMAIFILTGRRQRR